MIAVLFSFSSFTDFLQVFWFGWSCFGLFCFLTKSARLRENQI